MKKMVLVPSDLIPKQRPVDQQMSDLDEDMQKILASPGIPIDIKMKLYSDALARYGVKRREAEQPVQMAIQEVPPRVFPSDQDLLRNVPERKRGSAEALLSFLKDTPGVQFNERKELMLNGQPMAGTNVFDLFHHTVRDKSMNNLPIGWNEFYTALRRGNVPRMALGNRNIPEDIGTTSYAATQTTPQQLSTSSAQTTPIRASPITRSRVYKPTPQTGKGILKFDSLYK